MIAINPNPPAPSLPYPQRSRRLSEIIAKTIALILKILLWPLHFIATALATRCIRPVLFPKFLEGPSPCNDPRLAGAQKVDWGKAGKIPLEAVLCKASQNGPSNHSTVIFCCGNDGSFAKYGSIVELYRSFGLDVLLFNYRGVGNSKGTPSEAHHYEDVEQAYAYVSKVKGVPNDKILVHGYSFGGSLATHLAKKHAGVNLLLDRVYARASLIASEKLRKMGVSAPLRGIVRGIMEYAWSNPTEQHIKDMRGHWAIIASSADTIMEEQKLRHADRIVNSFANAQGMTAQKRKTFKAKVLIPSSIGHLETLKDHPETILRLRNFLAQAALIS
jgi:alpha-beta hydrolase superfamily lysophospholipase